MIQFIKNLFKPTPAPAPSLRQIAEGSRTRHRELVELWAAKGDGIPTQKEVFVDNAGRPWYALENPLKMGLQRRLKMDTLLALLSFNPTHPKFRQDLKKAEDLARAGNGAGAADIVAELYRRSHAKPAEDVLFEIALLMVYSHEENPAIYNPQQIKIKRGLANNDPELKHFFFAYCWAAIKATTPAN